MQSLILEIDGIRNEKQEKSKQFYDIEFKRNELINKLNQRSSQKEISMQKIKEFASILNNLTYDANMKDSRLKFLIETEKEKRRV